MAAVNAEHFALTEEAQRELANLIAFLVLCYHYPRLMSIVLTLMDLSSTLRELLNSGLNYMVNQLVKYIIKFIEAIILSELAKPITDSIDIFP